MFTENMKRTLGVIALLGLAALLVACGGPAASATAGKSAAGGITVVGQGEAYGQPDQAQVQAGVEIFAETVSEATGQNEAVIAQITAALGQMGINAEDIQTTNYSLWAEQIYGDRGPEGIAGYRVTNMVNVTSRDIDKVGEALAAVTDAGANSIYGINFIVADPAALEEEARAAAMADARKRAASLAELGGVSLGDVQLISEVIGQPAPMPFGFGGGDFAVMESVAVPSISPGELSYQVQVQVTFDIQ